MNFPDGRFQRRITDAFGASLALMRQAIDDTYSEYEHTPESHAAAVESMCDGDLLPPHPDANHRPGAYRYYFNCGEGPFRSILAAYMKSPEAAADYAESVLTETMPGGLPSDGSKGQWRTCHAAKVRTLEWLLGEEYCDYLKERVEADA